MKPVIRLFLVVFLIFQFLFLIPANSLAHCHQLVDKSGDSGSTFGFTDIVSTELSNQGNSIGVRITTSGNIPNGFGTTGQMVFGIMFPARLLSGDTNDDGINFITVHWKEDGTGWEGSQFIFRDSLQSNPWSANIVIDGNSASFSIPKELIGKGDLAYLVSIGLISEDGESSDYAPDNAFSDCFVVPSESPVSIPQTTGGNESQPSPQSPSEAPKKEGNKFIERPGVNRLTQKDPGQSLVLPEKTAASSSPKIIQSPQTQATEETKTSKPPALVVGLIVIALLAIGAVGASKYMLKNQEGEKQLDDCEKMRQYIKDKKERIEEYKKRLDEAKKRAEASQKSGESDAKRIGDDLAREERILKGLEKQLAECEKKLKAAGEGKDSAAGGGQGAGTVPKGEEKPKSGCIQGDVRVLTSKERTYRLLDKNRDIYFETDYKIPTSGDDGKNLSKLLKGLKILSKAAVIVGSGHPASIPASAIASILGMAADVAGTLPKIKGKFKVVYMEIPVIYEAYLCERQEICAGGKWHPRTISTPLTSREDIEKIENPGIMVEDIPSFIKKMSKGGAMHFTTITDPCNENEK